MTTETAYSLGWRQGSLLKADIEATGWVKGIEAGNLKARTVASRLWLVATQDCNLYRAQTSSNAPTIELRQVLDEQPPKFVGITSRKFLVDSEKGYYLVDDKPASYLSPKALTDEKSVEHLSDLAPDHVLALKTWLGNRYRRPAVPNELIPLAQAIAQAVAEMAPSANRVDAEVRDVLMQFYGDDGDRSYSLVAVLRSASVRDAALEWLAEAALAVPTEFGNVRDMAALTSEEVSLYMIENAYSANLGDLSWDESGKLTGAA